mmetsp:Transcript_973/g.2049  ORF Transcript_973/g.2049 Transcript_973/m.2049 type:complete len:103 (+) Transcript_973:1712-2020(+)
MIVKDKVVEFFQDLSLGTAQETWKIMHIATLQTQRTGFCQTNKNLASRKNFGASTIRYPVKIPEECNAVREVKFLMNIKPADSSVRRCSASFLWSKKKGMQC